MVINITKEALEKTGSLTEAIRNFYDLNLEGRLCVLDSEAMNGCVAKAYNQLGISARKGTYRKIVADFKTRTGYKEGKERRNLIVDVGCGSGILSIELAEQTDGIVLGIDLSKDMIKLANQNKERKAEEFVEEVVSQYKSEGYDFTGFIPASHDLLPEIIDASNYNNARTHFREGNVYGLSKLIKKRSVDYVVCRNTFHRLREPQKALKQMLKALRVGGKLYIRDLRRDADWKTVVERIGEKRWASPVLVKDYIEAMASMITIEELKKMLIDNGIKKYSMSEGSYRNGNEPLPKENIKEYEKETEYVCIVEKGEKS